MTALAKNIECSLKGDPGVENDIRKVTPNYGRIKGGIP